MNILKKIRKPYVSLLLASTVLFLSCSQHDENQIVESKVSKIKMSNNSNNTSRLTDDFYLDLEVDENAPTILNGCHVLKYGYRFKIDLRF